MQAQADNFWSRMSNIAWCPIVQASPHSCLPWAETKSKLQPPRAVRMRGDMWLVSSAMHILDAEIRYSL